MDRYTSPALCRGLGTIVFMIVGIGCFQFGSDSFGLGLKITSFGFENYGFSGVALLVFSSLVAMVASAATWVLVSKIEIEEDETDFAISTIWHFLANGSIFWIFAWGMCLTKIMGKEEAKEFVRIMGMNWSLVNVFIPGIIVSVVMGIFLLATKQFRYSYKPNIAGCVIASALPVLLGCYWEARILNLDSWLWILIAVLMIFMLMPFNFFMVARDVALREGGEYELL